MPNFLYLMKQNSVLGKFCFLYGSHWIELGSKYDLIDLNFPSDMSIGQQTISKYLRNYFLFVDIVEVHH